MREYAFRRLYVRELWRRVGREHDAVAIYGAGHHTRWLLDVTRDVDGPRVAAILDDDPPRAELASIPVLAPEALPPDAAAIVLSSDCFEAALAERARARFGDRLPIIRPYGEIEPGPFPWRLDEGALLREERLLVSDRHRFAFCPIQKVASTSLLEWFLRLHDVTEPVAHPFRETRARWSVAARGAAPPDGWFAFAFVRNPWSRLVTGYVTEFVRARFDAPRCDYEAVWRTPLSYTGGCTFREFVEYVHATRDTLNPHWTPQTAFLEGIRLDFVGRLERLEHDFAHVCSTIGVPAALPRRNASRYDGAGGACVADVPARDLHAQPALPPYPRFYTDDLAAMAADLYADDVARFGYELAGGAA